MTDAGPEDAAVRADRLRELQRGTDTATALAFVDTLPPVSVGEMTGTWRGSGLPTRHPYDGVLERVGWYGKRFDGAEAHPLLFHDGGGLVSINPAYLPLPVLTRYDGLLRNPGLQLAFRLGRRALATGKPRARLRPMEFRGVVSATMTYDALPIDDVFRAVEPDTVVGVMNLRALDRPFFFVLTRVPGHPPL